MTTSLLWSQLGSQLWSEFSMGVVSTGSFLAAMVFAPVQDAAAPAVDQLVLTAGVGSPQMQEALERFEQRLKQLPGVPANPRQIVRPLARDGASGALDGADVLLELARAAASDHAKGAFAFELQEIVGSFKVSAFDPQRGVGVTLGTRLEHEAGSEQQAERETAERIDEVVAEMLQSLRREQDACDAPADTVDSDPPPEPVDDDPIDLGFRFEYVDAGKARQAEVTTVLSNSALGRAGLRRGDRLVSIDGAALGSPADVGRALHRLVAGKEIALEVRRGAERLALKGTVQRASQVVPEFEQGLIGTKLPRFDAAASPDAHPRATVLWLFDPKRPDSLADAAQLDWIRARHPAADLAIVAVGVGAGSAALRGALEARRLALPAVADEDGRVAESLRTIELPALLIADADGVVRFRRLRGGRLQHALRALLAKH